MSLGSNTTDIAMINLVMTGADGAGGVWQDPVQLIPLGMANDPVGFAADLRAGLPLVNNLRVLFNEHSFNADGSMHPQMEAFLAAAVAQGFQLTMCYGEGDAQNIGIGEGRWPDLTNAEAYAALQENFTDVAGAWAAMMDWAAAHPEVAQGVYGWELMNESAGYRHSIRNNGAGDGLTATDFVELYTQHANQLADIIDARAEGRILVGGWGYNGDFLTLAETMINGESALDILRAGVGADLVWSAHLYPGWMGTDLVSTPAELIARLEEVYAPVRGDDVLITEINADGQINNPAEATDYADFYAASYEWFAANGIGLGWYPGVQTGASHLLYLEPDGRLTYRHQHSLAHALNAFSISQSPAEGALGAAVGVSQITVRLRNQTFEQALGENNFDSVTKAGFAFGYAGRDTITGADDSNDFLYGGTEDDILRGLAADDFLYGQHGNDQLYGGAMTDNLFGGWGNDRLDGGLGADHMLGGKGNDVYVVDNARDSIVEFAAEGIDLVHTNLASHTLGAQLENLTYNGTGSFLGTGTAGANHMIGGAGSDQLVGLGGHDKLDGAAGADLLDGGLGNDTMTGGSGNDTYIVGEIGDRVIDLANGGTDLVRTSLGAYRLAANLENLTYTGLGGFVGTGNALANNLTGGASNDRLSGLDGADTLLGAAGNDHLTGGLGADVLNGGAGIDTASYRLATLGVRADLTTRLYAGAGEAAGDSFVGIEQMEGSAFGDILSGDVGNNVIWGLGGNDTLSGRGGDDRIYGGAGAETFVFRKGHAMDRIMDFQNNIDTLQIGGFTGLAQPAAALNFAQQTGAHVLFDFGNGDRLLVLNITKAALLDDITIL